MAGEQKDAFLTCNGKDIYGLLRALITPVKLVNKTYDELMTVCVARDKQIQKEQEKGCWIQV